MPDTMQHPAKPKNRSAARIATFALLLLLAATPAAGFSRIISLYPAHTENLFYLGAGGRVIGVGRSDDFPPEVKNLPRFSYRGGPERIIAARPDLVLIRPMIARGYPGLIEKLEKTGIRVVSLQPRSVEGMFAYWRELGKLCGRKEAAERMIARFRAKTARFREVAQKLPRGKRKKVYFEAIHRRMKTFAAGSMALFCLETAGGINLAADARSVRNSNIAAYGKERILALADEIEVFLAQKGRMNRVTKETIMAEPGFSVIRAVREGRVYLVPEELVSRPTMRLLEGIALIRKILYGEEK